MKYYHKDDILLGLKIFDKTSFKNTKRIPKIQFLDDFEMKLLIPGETGRIAGDGQSCLLLMYSSQRMHPINKKATSFHVASLFSLKALEFTVIVFPFCLRRDGFYGIPVFGNFTVFYSE